MADNTDAATGPCPAAAFGAGRPLPVAHRDCFSEFLPTSDWVGFLGDRTMNFRLTARDGRPSGGGIGSAATKVTVAPLAGPFRVTVPTSRQSVYGLAAADRHVGRGRHRPAADQASPTSRSACRPTAG